MEKISGIVPSSQRITSVDMRDAHPVRPGTPLFGRPQGETSITSQAPVFVEEDFKYNNPLDQRNSSIVQQIADRFFGRNQVDVKPKEEPHPTDQFDFNTNEMLAPQELANDGPKSHWKTTSPDEEVFIPNQVEQEYNKGQYLDRRV